jgi:uncharacterized repeat protein (TIGR03803 family)
MKERLSIALRLFSWIAAAALPGVADAQVLEKVFDFESLRANSGNYLDVYPASELVMGPDGLLYGTTQGFTDNAGTVYKVTTSGAVTTIVSFPDQDASDWEDVIAMGCTVRAGVVRGGDGYLYGSASEGGESDCGIIFKVSTAGDFTKLVDFSGTDGDARGTTPHAELVAATNGYFYGTTREGGFHDHGVIFRMSPSGTMTTLVDFTGMTGAARGSASLAGLLEAPDGNFYGVTLFGGTSDLGTVFRVTPSGVFTTLADFTGQSGAFKGANPWGRLALGPDGNLYGTTRGGGASDLGTVFRITTSGSFTTLAEFTGGSGSTPGSGPREALLFLPDGNFFVLAGDIFKMSPSGQILQRVNVDDFGGQNPSALVYGGDGNLYGVGLDGEDFGTIFRLSLDGVGTKIAEAKFGPIATGELAALVQGSDGNLYGTTARGGSHEDGTIYRLKPGGEFATLVEFADAGEEGGVRGSQPNTLIEHSDGNLYGTTDEGGNADGGTVFRMTKAGVIDTLYQFGLPAANDGRHPRSLVPDPDGNLYGTTGAFGDDSTIFRFSQSGQFATLARFTGTAGATPGKLPNRLLRASDGNFYGTTREGGIYDHGTIFKMTPGGVVTVLHQFDGTTGNYTSTIPWQNVPIETKTGQFSISFKVRPNAAGMDGVTGLCFGPADSYSDIACAVRVNIDGKFDARDGSDYKATANYPYVAGTTYLVSMTGNIATKKYSVSVNGTPIATNFSFRSEQASVTTLDHLALRNESSLHPGTHTVTDVSLKLSGCYPETGLVEGNGGFLYGTTSQDGPSSYDGTYFRISPGGAFKEVNQFPANGSGESIGQIYPAPDGSFYGTSQWNGGAAGYGNVFRAELNGSVSTVVSFPEYRFGLPYDPLVFSTDGAMYGTFEGGNGGIYRIVSAGKPAIYDIGEGLVAASGTLLMQGKFSARGTITTIYLDYGEWSAGLPPDAPFANTQVVGFVNGFYSSISGTTLTGLTAGKTYRYQYRAQNSYGTTESREGTFLSAGPPQVALLPEQTTVDENSASIHGTVDAGNAATTAVFEYGETPDSFPGSKPAGLVEDSGAKPVGVTLDGLSAGKIYYYRLRATNVLGTAVSGTQSFVIPTAPVVVTGSASALSTTRARVEGTVDAGGGSATVEFRWGTDGINFPFSVDATPSPVSDSGPVTVSGVLTGLTQGTLYYYRIRASGPGGVSLSVPGTFRLSVLSGLLQVFPDPPPEATGSVTVNLDPVVGGWRFAGEREWRAPGSTVSHLASGDRFVEYRAVTGMVAPPDELVPVASGAAAVLERYYFATPVSGSGALTVTLTPADLAAPSQPEASRLQWRLINETAWRESGSVVEGLVMGSYLVECKPVDGRVTPPPATIEISGNHQLRLAYYEKNSPVGAPPLPLEFTDVSADESQPYAWLGQIRSAVGLSTGFVVKRRVVATAGHVVFDDGTLSYVTGLQWLAQQHAGTYEPQPLTPRGYYLAAGYAATRTAPGAVPGEGSPESQRLDYAALYFSQEAARGGYAGFLASESGEDNEFLSATTARKFLAGYAVDGMPVENRGRLHATARFTQALTPGDGGETWTTTAIHGVGGCSGGPLFVEQPGGAFYPAAIYLGGSNQTVVRAIDGNVIELFNRAETSANGGGNNTSGGITHTSVIPLGTVGKIGSLQVLVEPQAARDALECGWWLEGPLEANTLKKPGNTRGNLSENTYFLKMMTVPGFQPPVANGYEVVIKGGELKIVTFTYAIALSPLELWRQEHFGTPPGPEGADSADPDGDGWTNIDEYAAGTHPKSAIDVLRVLSSVKSGSAFSAVVSGKAGRRYVLERRADLSAGTWTDIDTVGPLSSNSSVQLTDPTSPPNRAFYRVRVMGP